MVKYILTFMTQSPRQMDLEGAQTSINGLSYERVPGRGVRFKYGDMDASPLGHMWFWRSEDLRGITLRLYYSGIVPNYIHFFVGRSSYSERHLTLFRLENSPDDLKSFDLLIPDRPSFKETAIFGFHFERRGASNKTGDFLIEKIERIEPSFAEVVPAKKTVKR